MLKTIELLNQYDIILASKSPRRKEILENIGLKFTIYEPTINEEDHYANHTPQALVRFLAQHKVKSLLKESPDKVIISADTIVVWENEILNKPATEKEAYKMLKLLSGTDHYVYTGYFMYLPWLKITEVRTVETKVTFHELYDDDIIDYIKTGSPFDKAGGYGIQDGFSSVFVKSIQGDYYNVMGFPVQDFYQRLHSYFLS